MAGTRDHGPGAVRVREGTRVLNRRESAGETGTVTIENTGDRPVQIGSHIHLPDVNAALAFDRRQTDGFRLDVPAGTSVRFEPGVSRTVPIVSLGGRKVVPGLQIRGATGGNADDPTEVADPTVAADPTSVADPTEVAGPIANDPTGEAGDR